MIFKNSKVYDVLKWIALVFFPAFTMFMEVVLKTLAVPYATEAVTIIAALGTFLGALVGVRSMKYAKEQNK